MRYPGKIINLFFLPVHDLANLTKNCHHKFEDSVLAKDIIMMSTPMIRISPFSVSKINTSTSFIDLCSTKLFLAQ